MFSPSLKRVLLSGRVTKATDAACEAFWAEVAKEFPEIKTGDMTPETMVTWKQSARAVIRVWLTTNWNEEKLTL